MVIGPERKGIKVTYCTDSRPTENIIENAKGADLFICEGMYGEDEKDEDAIEKKHMTMKEAAQIANKSQPNELWITHFSPSERYPENYQKEIEDIFKNTKINNDGNTISLTFEDI